MVDKDRIKKLLDKVYRLNYWFCNEMLVDEQHAAEFEEACKKANESGEPVIMVSAAEGNAKCKGLHRPGGMSGYYRVPARRTYILGRI